MKDILLCLVAFFTLTAYAQRGAWSGEISVQGMKIVMVLHLDDGHATLDVPTQGAKDIPAELTRNADGSILVSIPVIDASYEGKLEGNVVKGTFKQHWRWLSTCWSRGSRRRESSRKESQIRL